MTTKLNKPIKRLTFQTVRDAGKFRQLVVTLYPSGLIGIRPQGTRREEQYPIDSVYSMAVKARVTAERAAKRKGKKL